jgi:hypothetical protein
MSKDVKEENVITTLVNATATSQEGRELTVDELDQISAGWCEVGLYTRSEPKPAEIGGYPGTLSAL